MTESTFCPACGQRAPGPDRYCRRCGAAIADAATSGPIAEAEALAARGELTAAFAVLQRALAESDAADTHVALGTLELRRGDAAAMRRHLEQALAIDPGYALAYAYLGGLETDAGRIAAALDLLDRARALAPTDLLVALKRAELWTRLGVLDRAHDELRDALRNDGGAPEHRALAQSMLAAVDRKRQTSFVRRPVSLPTLPLDGVVRWLTRRPAGAVHGKPEVSPWR
ncbi:MAG: hypothetical protein KGK07_13735 [Chloroflexota bacterium]|nr:hypothetical protein [Chloroflexota bacterium]